MGSTVTTTDPYQVLGVSKDATPTAIRSAYRKLVLQTHPDKVQDESLRAAKQDEFQRIQQAYEILSDESKKQQYDEQVKFAQQKKDFYSEVGPRGGVGEHYEVRTAAPSREFDRKYEEQRRARGSFEDIYSQIFVGDGHTRKHDGYGHEARRTPRTHDDRKAGRDLDDAKERIRSDQRRLRERELRRGRDEKYRNDVDDYVDDENRVRAEEHPPRRKSGESRRREGRSASDESIRREPLRRRETGNDYDTKMTSAREYISEKSGARIQRSATSTFIEIQSTIPTVAEESTIRRSSARRPSDRDRTRGGSGHSKPSRRDSARESPIIVEPSSSYETRPRVIPSMPTATSSPANIRIPATPKMATPLRSATMQVPVGGHPPETPTLSRSSTMPVNGFSSTSRRRDPVMSGSSKMKSSRAAEVDSGYSSPSTPEMQWKSPISSSTRHGPEIYFEDIEPKERRYPTSSDRRRRAVSESDDEDDDRHERSVSPRTRGRSSEHITRPPLTRAGTTSAKVSSPTVSYVYTTRESSGRPTMMADSPSYRKEPIASSTAATRNSPLHLRTGSGSDFAGYHSSAGKLYREVSYMPREVHYSRRYGPDDIVYSEPRRSNAYTETVR